MSRYYVDSFAYDFDLFAPQTKKADNVLEINRRSSRKSASSPLPARRSRLRLSRPSALVMLLVMLLGLIAGNIYLRIKVTEVTSEISSRFTDKTTASAKASFLFCLDIHQNSFADVSMR